MTRLLLPRAVEVGTKLAKTSVVEGDTVRVDVSVKNKLNEGHGMAVAGPAGSFRGSTDATPRAGSRSA